MVHMTPSLDKPKSVSANSGKNKHVISQEQNSWDIPEGRKHSYPNSEYLDASQSR